MVIPAKGPKRSIETHPVPIAGGTPPPPRKPIYQSAYQGGPSVEVFSPVGTNPCADWKLSGGIHRSYDKTAKGYILTLEGGVTTKMQTPKDPKSTLGLTQQFLVFQILCPPGRSLTIELGVSDTGKIRRRLLLSTAFKEFVKNPLHAQVPLVLDAVRGTWTNLCFDLHNLVEHAFHATLFRSLDFICIGSNCKLRKVFTLRAAPFENVEISLSDEEQRGTQYDHKEEIPRCYCFPASIDTSPLTMIHDLTATKRKLGSARDNVSLQLQGQGLAPPAVGMARPRSTPLKSPISGRPSHRPVAAAGPAEYQQVIGEGNPLPAAKRALKMLKGKLEGFPKETSRNTQGMSSASRHSSGDLEEMKSDSPVNITTGWKKLESPEQPNPAARISRIVSPKSPAANSAGNPTEAEVVMEDPKPFVNKLSAESHVCGTAFGKPESAQPAIHVLLPLMRTLPSPDASPNVDEEDGSWQVLHSQSPNTQDSACVLAAFPAEKSVDMAKLVDSYSLHVQEYKRGEIKDDDKRGTRNDEQTETYSADKCVGDLKVHDEKVLAQQEDDVLEQKEEEMDNLTAITNAMVAERKKSDQVTSNNTGAVVGFVHVHDQDSISFIDETGAKIEYWGAGELEHEYDGPSDPDGDKELEGNMSVECCGESNGDISQDDTSKGVGSFSGEGEENEVLSHDEGDESDPAPTMDLERKRLELLDLEDSYLEEYGSLCIGQLESDNAQGEACKKFGRGETEKERALPDFYEAKDLSVASNSIKDDKEVDMVFEALEGYDIQARPDMSKSVRKSWTDAKKGSLTPCCNEDERATATDNSCSSSKQGKLNASKEEGGRSVREINGRTGIVSEVAPMKSPSSELSEGDMLELMYDPVLNCYYDPHTDKYYQLK